jgi:hypothetical protein
LSTPLGPAENLIYPTCARDRVYAGRFLDISQLAFPYALITDDQETVLNPESDLPLRELLVIIACTHKAENGSLVDEMLDLFALDAESLILHDSHMGDLAVTTQYMGMKKEYQTDEQGVVGCMRLDFRIQYCPILKDLSCFKDFLKWHGHYYEADTDGAADQVELPPPA